MDPFLGQIMMFAGNFPPRGWAFCDGTLLPISSNTALFSILGTTYGGDGRTTFALPDLRGRVAMHPGHGPGLSSRILGQKGGTESVTLTTSEMPSHNHAATGTVQAKNGQPDESNPGGTVPASLTGGAEGYAETPNTTMKSGGVDITVGNNGGNLPHTNVQPFNCVNYIIALQGVFPSRN
ncbi:phage tail protein [Maribellus sediminis]|uniref:phage tail protein n=1 Tax=Maribellus sediminis TaxID=2696285 RepID=UPI001981A012|nr:tail fiber protein [Maribellus sediminis]